MPETPAARARVRPPRASSPAAGSYDDTRSGHRSGYEVWRVVGHRRTRERSFEELRLAMRYIHGQQGGRFDIRLPDGVWFSEQRTRRVARVG